MSELHLVKMPGGFLRPANDQDAERLEAVANGRLLVAEVKQPRNPRFHRLFFALLNFAYEYFTPEVQEVKGMVPQKNFERFRKDILITAGFRDLVVNVKGEARWEAKSISFGSMDETEFHDVYRKVFSVCWALVLSKVQGLTEAEANNVVNQMVAFDG